MMVMPGKASLFMVALAFMCTVYMKGTLAQCQWEMPKPVAECKKALELNCGAASAPGIADNEHLCTPMCMDFLCSVETAGCEDGAYYSESVVPLLGAAPGCVDQESFGCGGGPRSPCSLKDIVGVPPASPAKCTPWPPVSNGTKLVCEADYCAGVKCASPVDFEKCGGCKSGACFPCPAEPANKPTPSQLVCQTAMTTLYGGACNGTTAGTLRATNTTMICGETAGFPRGYATCNTTECTACGAALATLKKEECKTEEAYANFVVPVDVEGGAITTAKAIAEVKVLDSLCEVRKQRLETEKCAGAGYTLVNDGKCFSAGAPIVPAVCGLVPNATVCNERAKSMLENCKSSVCSVGVDEGCTPIRALADAIEVDWYGPANGLLNGPCVQMAAQTTTAQFFAEAVVSLEGVTSQTFDESKFIAGIAATTMLEKDLIEVTSVKDVSSRRHLAAAGVEVTFIIKAADEADAKTLANDIVKDESMASKLVENLKKEGLAVTSAALVKAEGKSMSVEAATTTTTTMAATTTTTAAAAQTTTTAAAAQTTTTAAAQTTQTTKEKPTTTLKSGAASVGLVATAVAVAAAAMA